MRTNLILLSLLLVAAGIFFLTQYERGGSSVDPEDIAFAIGDTSTVHTILLTEYKRGEVSQSLGLYRLPTGDWSLNNQYPAFQPRVNQLLRVMHLIHTQELLAEKGQETALQLIELTHIQVEAFDQTGKKIKAYDLSVEGKGSRGSLMMLEGASMPVMVELPGHQGFVNGFYSLDPLFWRENLLFNANLSRIRSLEIQYPRSAEPAVLLQGNLNGLDWTLVGQEADSFRLAQYLQLYQGKIYAESFAGTAYPDMYSELQSQQPDIRFEIQYRDDTRRAFVLYSRTDNPNNYFAWVEGMNELLTVQRFVIDKFLLRPESVLLNLP